MYKSKAFALPTVLMASIVMIMVLVTAVSVTVAINGGLRDQRHTKLATLAAEAGAVMATACMNSNGGQATWTNAKPLKPNTDCFGDEISGASEYVLELDDVRTYFVVQAPLLGAGNVPVSAAVKGYTELLRSSSGVAWRVWGSDTSVALVTAGDGLPVGSLIEGFWTTAPAGYLLADGSAVSRSTYANLFSVIGTTYGAGDGSTTFNLPDTRGRVTVDQSSDPEFDVLGEKQGAKTHTLTVAQIPSHTHQVGWINNGTDISDYLAGSAAHYGISYWSARGGAYDLLEPVGGGQAHNNIQPSIVVKRAIKY